MHPRVFRDAPREGTYVSRVVRVRGGDTATSSSGPGVR
jgi:hypothetical protein